MLHSPLDLRQLLRSEFWHGPTQFGEGFSQAATMLQPVGGMGRIGDALGRRLGTIITYNAEVIALRRSGDDARVIWRDRASGAEQTAEAPYVLCTIPFPVLSRLDTDFKPAVKLAIARLDYIPAAKVAFRAARRFWELNDQIYGGISWTNREITQMWYPSSGFHERQGIIVGAYVWTAENRRGLRREHAGATARNCAGERRARSPRLSRRGRRRGVGCVVKNPVQPRRLGGVDARRTAAGLRAPAGAGRPILFCRRAHELDPRLAGRRSPLRPRSDRRNRQKGEEVAVARRVHSWLLCRPDTRERNHLLMSTDPARSHSRDGRWCGRRSSNGGR